MNHRPSPAKLLLCIVDRHRGNLLVDAAKRGGGRGGTIILGRSVGDSRLLRALSLADIQQDVVAIVTGGEVDDVIAKVREEATRKPKKLSGEAMLLDVPELFLRRTGQEAKPASQPNAANHRSEPMESGYKLIITIVNFGFGEDVIAAARQAGATGGTILNASGTGTEEDVKFLGITLVPEKDMLLIVAEQDKVQPIFEALSAIPALAEPGSGIFFSLNVEGFFFLGGQRPWAGSRIQSRPISPRLENGGK